MKSDRRIVGSLGDRRLVRELQKQDPRAVEKIGERFGRMLRGYLIDALGDSEAAQDVLQLTMIDVWRRGPTFDPGRASLATWLLMIARSRAVDHHRRRVPEPYDPAGIADVLDADREDTADALLEHWRMAGLLLGLPKQEARLLSMRFYEGLTQRQISERTGIPLGTVKMRMVRALDRLRQALQREDLMP